jgi:hypothetical protein
LHKKKQSKIEVNTEDPLIVTNDANPKIVTDIEIEVANENQLTDMSPINKPDKDFEFVMSKSKRKQEKRK